MVGASSTPRTYYRVRREGRDDLARRHARRSRRHPVTALRRSTGRRRLVALRLSDSIASMDAITTPPAPINEPNLDYAPGSPERASVEAELAHLAASPLDLTATIGGAKKMGGGAEIPVVQPHDHASVLGVLKNSTRRDAQAAVQGGRDAAPGWRAMSFDDRAAIILKAADLLAGPWRARLNAATMLGQSKTVVAGRDRRRLRADRLLALQRPLRARQILADQPIANSPGVWNRTDHRPLEGFVYAITPFNFTAIAGNLPTAPALMGNTVIWKPSPTQQLAAHLTMELLEEAGLPPGVINMLPGDGLEVSDVAPAPPRPRRHPLHRLDADLPEAVGHGGGEAVDVPLLPAHRRRDRRQGLHRRPPLGRRRRAAGGDDPRRLRVPGAEVLGRLACLRAARRCGRGSRTSSSPRPRTSRWATSPTCPTSWAR